MPKAKNFNAFTYGVGLELNASSFKSVKDTLKSDLDSLSKMVKAYNKMLEINPDTDLSEVIKEFKDMQTIISQIKGSSNPFSEFVDKGLLSRISALENGMKQMMSMSEKFGEQLASVMKSVSSDIKGVGEFKFPGTFGQLFDDVEKKTKEIDTLKNKIAQLKQELDNLEALDSGIFDVLSADNDNTGKNKKTLDEINQMLNDFNQLYKKIQSFDSSKGNILDIKPLVRQAAELGTQLQNAFSDYDFYDVFDEKFGEDIILSFQDNFKKVQICVQQEYQALEDLIQQEEKKLASLRSKQSTSQGDTSVAQTIANIGKSNTETSGLTYTVKVIPKANASEWTSVINRTIASVQDKLDPIYLKPTFSKNSKSMEKDVSGNLAQLSNTVKVNFSIVDNLDQSWDDVIDNIKSKIDNANRQLSQKAKIKVAFAKDENFQEDFKNSVYKVVNSIKNIKASIYITNGKKFLKDIEGIRTSAESKLKDIGANLAPIGLNFEVKNRDEILSNMDSLRAEIEGKVQNIGATIADLPKMMLQAMMYGAAGSAMGSAAAQNVVPNTSGNISASSQSANQQAASVGKMSERAKEAARNIKKLQAQIDLLNNKGFKANKFVELGDFDNKIQPIKKSQKALKEMLAEYKLLEYRLSGSKEDIAARYTTEFGRKAFDEWKKDSQRKIELEQQLGNVVQNQIKYLKKKKQLNQEIINQSQTKNNGKNSIEEQSTSLDKISKRAQQAAKDITRINEQLTSLKTNGINSDYFFKLGNFDENFKHIKGSNQEVRALLKKYSVLQSKLSGTASEVYKRYAAKYGKSNANAAINEDIVRQKELESQLSKILQNQIGYLERKAALSQDILNKAQKTVTVEENSQNKPNVENKNSMQSTPAVQGTTSFVAQIDNASLSNLAKDSTLRDISGKLDTIIGQLKTGIKVDGKYEASSSSDSDVTGKKESSTAQEKQKAEAASASSKKESTQVAKQQLEVEQEITKEITARTALEQKENNNKQEQDNYDYSSYSDDFYEQFQKWAQERAKLEGYTIAKVKGVLNKNNELVGASVGFTKNGSQEGVVETFKLIEDKESGLKEFIRTSTQVTSNVQQYQKTLDAAYVKQTALATSYTKQINNLQSALDPNVNNTLFGTEYEGEVNQKIKDILDLVQALHQIDENGNIKIFDSQELSDQKAVIELLLADLKAYIKESQNTISANNRNQKTDETAYSAKLKELEKTVQKIELLKAQAEGKINTGENTQAEAQKKLAAEKENYEIIKNELTAFTQVYDAEKVAKKEAEARAKAEQKVADIIAKQKDAVLTAKENRINSTVNKAQSNYDLMLHQSSAAPLSDSSLSKLKEYKNLLDELKRQQESFNNDSSLFDDEKAINNFNKLSLKLKDVKKEYDALLSASIKFMNKIENASDLKSLDSSFNAQDVSQLKDAMQEFANSASNGEATLISFNAAEKTATYQIKDAKGQLQELHIEYDKGTNSLGRYVGAVKEVQSGFQKFVVGLKGKFKGVLQYVMSFGSFYQILSVIKKGLEYVKEIDTALTELKKVTDETDKTYANFLKTMAQTGAEVGATVKDLTNMAASWARLGYSIQEAGELAKSTAVLLNVSEFADADSASEALISTMQAYGYAAEDSMHVVDVLNEVGNNFAISSDGIATALQDSASSLMAAGNNLEQSVAMIAAANKVLQDPNSVGAALRTISLRIRGTSTKVLEEMGEETDGVIESVSKLQAKVKGLSGVDILTDTGAYKDTYTIIKEIAQVWDQMNDIDRAALLELLAGKNRSNAMAALLTNLEDLGGAYESAMAAQGSAEAENEKYLNSIQGKIDLFNNSLQTMWMKLIDSDVVKSIVDIGTDITGLITKFGLLGTVITAVFGTKLFKAASAAWKFAKAATEAEYAKAKASAAATAAKEAEAAVNAAESATETVDNKTTEENAKTTAAKAAASNAAAKQKEAEAEANAAESATENVNNAEKNMSKYSLGGIKKGWGKFKDTAVKFLGTTVGKITAVGAVIGGVAAAVKLTKNYIKRKQADLAQEVQDLTNNYKETKTKIDANLKSLSESSESTQYQTLSDEFSVLAAGVDRYGNNISLTSDQYERYKSICEQIIGIQPSLAEGYDSATQAIGNNANALRELIELQQETARRNAEEYTSDDNLKKARKNTINKIEEAKKDLSSGISDLGASLLSGLKSQTGTDYGFTDTASDDVARTIMTQVLGFDEDNVDDILKEYFNKSTDINTAWNRWLSDYASQIKEHRQGIADLIGDVDKSNDFQTAISNYATAADSISQAQEDFINTLLQVPMSQTDYSKLGDSGKSFITEWIKNSDAFKIDETTSKSTVLEMKKTIRGMVTELANNEEAQDILDSLFTIDTSKTNFEQYKKDVNEWLDMLFESLGITDKDEQNRIKIALGFDFEVEDEEGNTKQGQLVKDIARVTGDTEENIQEWLDSQPAAKVQALMQVDWSAESGLTTDEVLQKVESTIPKEVTVSKTYSDLKNSIDEVNDTLSQSSEIIIDNVELTEEQGKAIESLIGTEEDFADAIDTTNGYVVKNATLLKKLLNTKKQEALQNVKISKSQARLQYYELYKKIRQLSQGNQELAIAHKEEINALYAEMGAIEKTIAKYSMLEQQLLGATNAYEKFEEAKTIDEEKDYGSKASDMLSGLIQGLQSAKLGTESFQAAVSGMIPDVYSGLSTVEEKVQAIANYLKNSNFSKYFTLEFEDDGTLQSAEMKLDNVKAFIEDAQEVGALTNKGDWKHFELDESIKTLDDFCNAMQITKEMAFAMFTEIDSYDAEWLNGDFGSMLDNLDLGLEGNIFMASKHITELDVALANGKISAEEYAAAMYGTGAAATESQKEIGGLAGQMQQYTQSARKSASEWKKASDGYEESKKKVEDLSKQIQQATKGADTSKLEEELASAMEDMDKYAATMRDNEVSELVIKVAMDDVDNSIKFIENKYIGIKNLIEQDNENGGFKIKTGINWESAPADEDTVNNYLALLNEKHTLEVMQGESLPTTLDVMQEMRDTLKTITEILAKHYGVNIETGEAEDSITRILNQLGQIKPKSVVITVLGNISNTLKTWWGRLTGSGELNGSANDSTDAKRSRNNNVKVNGTAHATGSWGLKSSEHNALVGELGMETVVDPNTGKYYTVGNRGAEFVDLPRGAIIFNHKQTEALFKNGYVTSRGKMLANGNAHATGNAHVTIVPDFTTPTYYSGASNNNFWTDWNNSISNSADSISDASSAVEDAADDAKQTIDFIEYRLEEIENSITNMTNRVENFLDDTSQIGEKNSLYEDLVGAEKQKASTYFAAAELYNKRAAQLLSKVPSQYQEMAKNGAIAIKDFIGESEGEIADAIEEYRTWSTKADDAENNYLASIAEISAKRLEQLQDIADDFENIVGLTERQSDILQGEMDLLEESGERLSENFYKELMKDSQKQISDLNNKRDSLQDVLDQSVKSGDVKVGSDDWYEMVNTIYDVDDAILECKKDIEGFQNSINDLYWDNLDKLIDKIDNVDSELSHLYNLVSDEEKVVDEFGNWTKDGVTALGLLAQQLEVANFKVEQYGEAIAHLEKDYAAGLYSTDEYNEKLAELKENQWDAIEAQESAKKSIIDLNKTRIQAVKDGIQKEIDAYSELIDKKKEELSLQKEAHDFSKQVEEQQKNIADIQKRLAAMSGDNSASAIAQKKKLQAELSAAQKELEELYYDHSVEKQQEALDKQLENYQNNKQDEMDALDESLKNENQIIQDSYATIAANTELLAQNLSDIADRYGISLSDSVTKPWENGANAIGTYQDKLNTATSAFTKQLRIIKQELTDLQAEADKTANSIISATNTNKETTEGAKYEPPTPAQQPSAPSKPTTPAPPSKGASVTVKKSATNFSRDGGNGTRMQSWVPGSTFTVYQVSGSEVLIGRNGGYTGWVKLSDIEGYASGAKSINKDQFAFLDELGEELQLVPDGAGRLSYVKKGTGIIPADLTERLMEWGQLDPSSVLEQSKPTVSAPHVINNNIELNMQVGEVVHIDHADNGSIPNITKAIQDQMDNYMKNINKKLYNRVR